MKNLLCARNAQKTDCVVRYIPGLSEILFKITNYEAHKIAIVLKIRVQLQSLRSFKLLFKRRYFLTLNLIKEFS